MIKLHSAIWPKDIFTNFEIKQYSAITGTRMGEFVKRLHYSKSLARGCNKTFVLWSNGLIYGVAMFGSPVSRKAVMYSSGKGSVIECKRFVLARKAPKNVASWFLAKCIKELKRDKSIDTILSYADPEQDHKGTLYKAANFRVMPTISKKTQVIQYKDKIIHQRAAYQKIGGVYTKTAIEVQEALRNGTAKNIYLAPKLVFCYPLKK
jgi:hypothetical protein